MRYYSAITKGYGELHGEEQKRKLRLIKEQVGLPGSVLDLGGGHGLAKQFFRTLTVDPTWEGLSPGDVCGTAEWLPFKDKSFDHVLCLTAIHHCDLEGAIKEIRRVCRGKGVVTVLKKAKGFTKIVARLHQAFALEEIEDEHDLILYGPLA